MSNKTAAGLMGEIGLHHLDLINWYLSGLPTAVQGFGSITNWNDGREAADTIQTIFEYPAKVRAVFTSTLTSRRTLALRLRGALEGAPGPWPRLAHHSPIAIS